MSCNYHAGQFEDRYKPSKLGNWCTVEKNTWPGRCCIFKNNAMKMCCHVPTGITRFIADEHGHLLPDVPRDQRKSPWGKFVTHAFDDVPYGCYGYDFSRRKRSSTSCEANIQTPLPIVPMMNFFKPRPTPRSAPSRDMKAPSKSKRSERADNNIHPLKSLAENANNLSLIKKKRHQSVKKLPLKKTPHKILMKLLNAPVSSSEVSSRESIKPKKLQQKKKMPKLNKTPATTTGSEESSDNILRKTLKKHPVRKKEVNLIKKTPMRQKKMVKTKTVSSGGSSENSSVVSSSEEESDPEVNRILQDFQKRKPPVLLLYGQSMVGSEKARAHYFQVYAKTYNAVPLRLDDKIKSWSELSSSENKLSTTDSPQNGIIWRKQHRNLRLLKPAIKLSKKLMSDASYRLNTSETLKLLKYAMLDSPQLAGGFIIDGFPDDLDEALYYEPYFWDFMGGIQFVSEALSPQNRKQQSSSPKPESIAPKYFKKDFKYNDEDIDHIVDYFGSKSIKIYAGENWGVEDDEYMNHMMDIFLKTYSDKIAVVPFSGYRSKTEDSKSEGVKVHRDDVLEFKEKLKTNSQQHKNIISSQPQNKKMEGKGVERVKMSNNLKKTSNKKKPGTAGNEDSSDVHTEGKHPSKKSKSTKSVSSRSSRRSSPRVAKKNKNDMKPIYKTTKPTHDHKNRTALVQKSSSKQGSHPLPKLKVLSKTPPPKGKQLKGSKVQNKNAGEPKTKQSKRHKRSAQLLYAAKYSTSKQSESLLVSDVNFVHRTFPRSSSFIEESLKAKSPSGKKSQSTVSKKGKKSKGGSGRSGKSRSSKGSKQKVTTQKLKHPIPQKAVPVTSSSKPKKKKKENTQKKIINNDNAPEMNKDISAPTQEYEEPSESLKLEQIKLMTINVSDSSSSKSSSSSIAPVDNKKQNN